MFRGHGGQRHHWADLNEKDEFYRMGSGSQMKDGVGSIMALDMNLTEPHRLGHIIFQVEYPSRYRVFVPDARISKIS